MLPYWTNMHRGGRSSTGQDAAHHGMMLSVVQRSQQRGAREGLQTTTFQSVRASMASTVQPPACSLSTEVRRWSHTIDAYVTVTRRPYGPSCGRCYSHSLTTLLASLLTTTRNTSRRRSIAFAHRQRHHCRPQSTSAMFLSYFLPGGRQPSKK